MLVIKMCVLLAIGTIPAPAFGANKSDYYDLYDWLFEGDYYKKQIRPTEFGSTTTEIYLKFKLLSINEVDEKEQTFITSARFAMYWNDVYLAWDTADYGDIYSILIPQSNVYRPDVVIGNSATAQKALGYNELPVRIYYNGLVEWEPTSIIATSCEIDITFFPFDTQKCRIILSTAVATYEEITMYIAGDEPLSMADFSENGQWEVVGTAADNIVLQGNKSEIAFDFLIQRRRTFYVMNIILPIFFLSLTASLVFALPAEEGEKMGTGITVLLAFAVYLTILSDLVPNTSLQISILGLYLTILLGFSAISLIVCAFILRLHARPETDTVGPRTTKAIRFLQNISLCGDKNKDVQNEKNRVTPIASDDIEIKDKKIDRLCRTKPTDDIAAPKESGPEPLTWQQVAFTLDIFCFISFTSLTILSTVACLLAVGIGGMVNVPSL